MEWEPKEKSLYYGSEKGQTQYTASCKTASRTHYQLSYSSPDSIQYPLILEDRITGHNTPIADQLAYLMAIKVAMNMEQMGSAIIQPKK